MQLRNTRTVYGLYPEANRLFYACPPPEYPREPAQAEKNLMWAILVRAVQDASGNIGQGWSKGEIQEKAITWIFDELDFDTPFTYGHICLTLDIDAEKIRGFLRKGPEPVYRNKSTKKLAA